ncbi:hypothetical protein [uncultured Azonexus sp.]|uniref:hypothetical protein n=1 Tax=uncultured Azonexus sp. TaxID=520307 RepID=UPI00261749E9|nr:hypothetical protein [uncultured Azonexus sp.]
MKRILAVASSGGHWIQLCRLHPVFNGYQVSYLSTNIEHAKEVDGKLYTVIDANQWSKFRMALMFLQVAWVLIKSRPDVIISTGAAVGLAAILWGKVIGAKTIWVDSIANAEELSGSGAKVGRFADVWLTQWEHLARPGGPQYWGSVL